MTDQTTSLRAATTADQFQTTHNAAEEPAGYDPTAPRTLRYAPAPTGAGITIDMTGPPTAAFPIPEATLAVECWMTNPLRPGAIAVSVDGKLMATVRLDQFKATAARLAELERELQEQRW